jgi:hypothetical protein
MPARNNPQTFPAIFGPYDRTEMLAALHRLGPIRSPILKNIFGGEAGRAIKRPKANPSRILAATRIQKGRHGCADVIGINPTCPVIPQIGRLLDKMTTIHPLREIENDIRPDEVAQFYADQHHPPVDLDCLLGTAVQTRTLVALWALGGRQDIGKLQRSVFEQFVTRVRVAIMGFVKMGVLVKNGISVEFKQDLEWLPELLDLLAALAPHLPTVTAQVQVVQKARKKGKWGTAHSAGTEFRFVGSRVNQGILAYLAVHGPSAIMKISAAVASVNPQAIEPLIRAGLVCRIIINPNSRSKHLYSLNAAHPVYKELRAFLRTRPILEDSFPVDTPIALFDRQYFADPNVTFLPYPILGTSHKTAVTDMITMLEHTPNREANVTSLADLVAEHSSTAAKDTMLRFLRLGVLVDYWDKGLRFFRLDETWPAHVEFRNLLLAIGREWPEYAEGGAVEAEMFSDDRKAREKRRNKRITPESPVPGGPSPD